MQECKVVFLDRDGVINKRPPMHEYVKNRAELIVLPDVADAIRRLNEAGFFVYVVSNQRGINRGHMTMEDLNDVHCYLNEILGRSGAHIDGFYVCPHGVDECDCRKPKPGLLIQAENDLLKRGLKISKAESVMIGDSDTDIQAGEAYGVDTVKIGDNPGEAENLEAAVDLFLGGKNEIR